MNIYVCGNPLVKEDCLPLKILPLLRKKLSSINFVEFEPTEDLPHKSELVFIDTVINAKDVMVFDNVDKFVETNALSLHDFDLGLNLKMAKKVKQISIISLQILWMLGMALQRMVQSIILVALK